MRDWDRNDFFYVLVVVASVIMLSFCVFSSSCCLTLLYYVVGSKQCVKLSWGGRDESKCFGFGGDQLGSRKYDICSR